MTLERLAGDETLLCKTARAFASTAPELLASIGAALSLNNLERAYSDAHTLKRAVAAFEAPLVLNSVLNVERHAINDDAQGAAEALPRAANLIERLLHELAPIAHGSALQADA